MCRACAARAQARGPARPPPANTSSVSSGRGSSAPVQEGARDREDDEKDERAAHGRRRRGRGRVAVGCVMLIALLGAAPGTGTCCGMPSSSSFLPLPSRGMSYFCGAMCGLPIAFAAACVRRMRSGGAQRRRERAAAAAAATRRAPTPRREPRAFGRSARGGGGRRARPAARARSLCNRITMYPRALDPPPHTFAPKALPIAPDITEFMPARADHPLQPRRDPSLRVLLTSDVADDVRAAQAQRDEDEQQPVEAQPEERAEAEEEPDALRRRRGCGARGARGAAAAAAAARARGRAAGARAPPAGIARPRRRRRRASCCPPRPPATRSATASSRRRAPPTTTAARPSAGRTRS